MVNNLPNLAPHNSILSLTPLDDQLNAGLAEVLTSPKDPSDKHLLVHAGIRQAVYLGTHLFAALCDKEHMKRGGQLPPIMIYRYILDLGDSIATLLRFGAGASAFSILRSLFESSLALQFILEGNRLHSERANAYYVSYLIGKHKVLRKQDGSTDMGTQFRTLVLDDPALKDTEFPQRDTRADRDKIDQLLSSEDYQLYWNNYKQAKKKGKPYDWYCLCSDVTSRRGLANVLKREGEYEVLYSYLSSIAHAEDVFSEYIIPEQTGESQRIRIHKLRGTEKQFKIVTSMTANYLMMANDQIFYTYLPAHDELRNLFGKWYQKYRDYFLWMTSTTAS
jgi:hypothetical protein